jgi:streptogramin lyase
MKYLSSLLILTYLIIVAPESVNSQSLRVDRLPKIRLKMYIAEGLVWNNESTQNTNWNKIAQTPDGKIWFTGGDHWGTDATIGNFKESDNYERPWGFGNTAICSFDPATEKVTLELELDRASAIYSNAEMPGHGKIHGNIASDSKGNLYFAGYMGMSFVHEYTRAYYPKSYPGGAILKYDPSSGHVDYLGIPYPYGANVALYYDEKRDILNGITPDRAKFWRLKVSTMELNRYESVARMSRLEDRVREMIMDRNGYCYFANDVGGLTRFDPDSETFTDIDVRLPGKTMDFRASVVSTKNIIYCISTDGFVWSFDTSSGRLTDLGHVIGMPEQPDYTPNIALDEDWARLYFIAGNHGGEVLESALEILTVLDLKTKKFHWLGQLEGVEGCFGALSTRDHTVYFSCFGNYYKGNEVEKDASGRPITRPYLLKYEAPENLEAVR